MTHTLPHDMTHVLPHDLTHAQSTLHDTCSVIFQEDCGVRVTTDNAEVVRNADVIIIAVKPHIVAPAIKNVASLVTEDHLIISIAAGISLRALEEVGSHEYLP